MLHDRKFPRFTVNKKAETSLRAGHPWVYGEEIISNEGTYSNGDIGDVVSEKGIYLGSGFINDNSKIRIRIISTNPNDDFSEAFFQRRIKYAIEYRRQIMGDQFDNCRLIFGEADQFPGFTVDRFNDVLVMEILSYGIEMRKEMLYNLLLNELDGEINVIFERNESSLRIKEGLSTGKGFVSLPGLKTDTDGTVIIRENGIFYKVDYINGQKTGFFLDQKFNRRAAAALAKGKRVLDCFTHTGAFALNCAKSGAASVTAVDISSLAIEETRTNAEMNGVHLNLIQADVFDLLTEYCDKKCKDYDYIILDPPAFTKSNATQKNAYSGYKEINRRAMQLLPRGGYLATCSCSHFMRNEDFKRMLNEAAHDSHVTLRQIEERQQGPDHPILPTVPETDYLKFYLLQIV